MVLSPQQLEAMMPDASQVLSDEPEVKSDLHYTQLLILVNSLSWLWSNQNDYFIGANLSIYFSRQQLRNSDLKGPDFFVVRQTEKRPRNSWVVWEEDGKYPNVIIDLVSDTADSDRESKKNLYQDIFHTPEYFYFSPETLEFAGYRLVGSQYQEISSNVAGWTWSQELGLYLGIDDDGKLRYFTSDGSLVPTEEEAALQAESELEQEEGELVSESIEI